MPQIKVPKLQKSFPDGIQVEQGANLMQSLLAANLPVASSCDGEGICAKCRIKILEGANNLSAPREVEVFLKENNNIAKEIRISCQTQVLGDVSVDATYW